MKSKYQSPSGVQIIRHLFSSFKTIIIVAFIAAVGSVIYVLTLNDVYRSSANLFPSEERSVGLDILSGRGLGALTGGLIGGRNRDIDRLYVLLNSESSKRRVIEEFDLMEVYETAGERWPMTITMGELEENTSFRGLQEGNFIIEVWDEDPARAKAMVEFYVQLVSDLSIELAGVEARNYREFIEQRYNLSLQTIDDLRNRMQVFQESYGIYELPEQVLSNLQVIADLMARKIEAQARLEVFAETLSPENDLYKTTQVEVNVLDQQIQNLYNNSNQEQFLINFPELPKIASEYYTLLQDIEVEIQIQKVLLPLYEQARLEEQKSLPVVTVVDPPQIAEKKDRPFRSLIVILSVLSAGILVKLLLVIQLHYSLNRAYFKELLNSSDEN
jgi:capsule polysaccharide export protein KpsE/RkpR